MQDIKKPKGAAPNSPFTVPEGYFAQLTTDVMSRLPEREESVIVSIAPRRNYFRVAIAAAAVACFAVFGTVAYQKNFSENNMLYAIDDMGAEFDNAIFGDGSSDYIIIDNETIYSYLSE